MSSGFFRGTSVDQDSRWGNSDKKIMKKMKFAEVLGVKVDTTKVKLDVINKWVSERITEILGFEDDIVIGTVINSLEEKNPDPKQLQLDITGFLEKKSPVFVEELWTLLTDAQQQKHGIPTAFIEKKKAELANKQVVEKPKSEPLVIKPPMAVLEPPLSNPTKSAEDKTMSESKESEKSTESFRKDSPHRGRDYRSRDDRDDDRDRERRRRRSRSGDRRNDRSYRSHDHYSNRYDRDRRRRSRSRSR